MVSAGAKIIGSFTVGENSKIGAGSVVLKPVPPNSTVVGVPGRVVKRNNKKMPRAEMDQVNLPDPVLDALRNDDPLLNAVGLEAAQKLYGEEGVREMQPLMGSEDFSMFAARIPGLFAFVGCNSPGHDAPHHNDSFNPDEAALQRGAALAAQFAYDYLAKGNKSCNHQ